MADCSPAFHYKSAPDEKSELRAFHSNQVYSQSLVLVLGAKFIVCQSVQRTPTESGVEDPVNRPILIVIIIKDPSTTLRMTDSKNQHQRETLLY